VWREALGVAVVLHPEAAASVEELQQWCRDRSRSTKTPKVIRFQERLPYDETGQLLRRVIRDELAAA
jgi:acyl-CoA synthetase (AMP-forming)/AMP-acid ligase II